MNTKSFFAVLVAFIAICFLSAQVVGPTTRTPRLAVGNPALLAAFGSVSIQNDLNVEGATTIAGGNATFDNVTVNTNLETVDLNITGTCTGCTGQVRLVNVVNFTDGCSNDPEADVTIIATVELVAIRFDTDVSCTSDGVNFSTAAGAIDAEFRPVVDFVTKYTALDIAATPTDACVIVRADGSLAFTTGVDCATTPGNVAKDIVAAQQTMLFYQRNL